jgi:SDR family mycofactocin-dependent oxidoreductase
MGRFDDAVVLVTGAAKGQGRSHALGFAREGARAVVICDLAAQLDTAGRMGTVAELEETGELVRAAGAQCETSVVDVRDDDQLDDWVGRAVREHGRIDVLVCNAGIASYAPFDQLSETWWHEMIDINLGGVAGAIRAVAPHMVNARSGRIVATSSAAGREGVPNCAHYSAAKWGVIGLVKSAALELGPLGITVNAVCPMSVDTDMCHNAATYSLFMPAIAEPTREDAAKAFTVLNSMDVPWLDPSDVTEAVLFLASPGARYITGVALDVAAGWNALHVA